MYACVLRKHRLETESSWAKRFISFTKEMVARKTGHIIYTPYNFVQIAKLLCHICKMCLVPTLQNYMRIKWTTVQSTDYQTVPDTGIFGKKLSLRLYRNIRHFNVCAYIYMYIYVYMYLCMLQVCVCLACVFYVCVYTHI